MSPEFKTGLSENDDDTSGLDNKQVTMKMNKIKDMDQAGIKTYFKILKKF